MHRLRKCICLKTSSSSLLLQTTTRIFIKLPLRLWRKAKGCAVFGAKRGRKKKGLMSLYKDKEMCEGYGDIEIMWEIIHPTSSKDVNCTRPFYAAIFCFNSN